MADEEHEYLRSSADESVVDYLIERLDDPLPESRQEAAIALADLQGKAPRAVPVLLGRLRSTAITPHDRACAAWALGCIKHDADSVVPVLSAVMREPVEQKEAGEMQSVAKKRRR